MIGGARIFAELLDRADRIYWTEVEASVPGDVYFPQFEAEAGGWREVSREALARGEKDEFAATLRILDRANG